MDLEDDVDLVDAMGMPSFHGMVELENYCLIMIDPPWGDHEEKEKEEGGEDELPELVDDMPDLEDDVDLVGVASLMRMSMRYQRMMVAVSDDAPCDPMPDLVDLDGHDERPAAR